MTKNDVRSRHVAVIGSGIASLVVSLTTASLPTASAAPDGCSAQALSETVSTVLGAAGDFLGNHPGANAVITAAYGQQPAAAEADIRGYFTANPVEYQELRGILAPIGEAQGRCGVTALPPAFASAYDRFMMG